MNTIPVDPELYEELRRLAVAKNPLPYLPVGHTEDYAAAVLTAHARMKAAALDKIEAERFAAELAENAAADARVEEGRRVGRDPALGPLPGTDEDQ